MKQFEIMFAAVWIKDYNNQVEYLYCITKMSQHKLQMVVLEDCCTQEQRKQVKHTVCYVLQKVLVST